MVATQAQRAALYTNLAEQMGQEAAETLMDELPPGGWHQMATKEDLAGVELRLRTAFTEALAETNVKLAESHASLIASHAESHVSLVESQAKLVESHAESHAKLVESHAALQVAMHQGFAEAAKERAEIVKAQAEAAKERAEIVKAQARQLYVIVATIAAATVSIWIALFTTAPGG